MWQEKKTYNIYLIYYDHLHINVFLFLIDLNYNLEELYYLKNNQVK